MNTVFACPEFLILVSAQILRFHLQHLQGVDGIADLFSHVQA